MIKSKIGLYILESKLIKKSRKFIKISCLELFLVFFFISFTPSYTQSALSAGFNYSSESGSVVLTGPWQRYEGEYSPDILGALSHTDVFFQLKTKFAPDSKNLFNYPVTYSMTISCPENLMASNMAIFVPAIVGLKAVFIDNKQIFNSNNDSVGLAPIVFTVPGQNFKITMQVHPLARGFDRSSTFPSFVLFGDSRSVQQQTIFIGRTTTFFTVFFILIGLLSFCIFIFQKKNKLILGFSIAMLCTGLLHIYIDYMMFSSQVHLSSIRMIELTRILCTNLNYFGLLFFFYLFLKKHFNFFVFLFAVLIFISIGSLVLINYLTLFSALNMFFGLVLALLIFSYLIYLVFKKNKDARWLLFAVTIYICILAFNIFGPSSVFNACFIRSFGLLIFDTACMLMLLKGLSQVLTSQQKLTEYTKSMSDVANSFIPPEFLKCLDKNSMIDIKLGDHVKKEMTIFFSDIRSFTDLSEKLTVEENFSFINSYLARMVPVIISNGGFVDKYIGDAIMALFEGDQGPDSAIRAGIEMQKKMVEYNQHRTSIGYRPLSTGIGIHTGSLMLGVIGVNDRMENTVISDAVNLASRLQSVAKSFNVPLVISEQAFKGLEHPGAYHYRFIGKIKVKGKSIPVSVFEIFDGAPEHLFERKLKANTHFEQGILFYYQKDYAKAGEYFIKASEIIPEDGATSFYLAICRKKLATMPM